MGRNTEGETPYTCPGPHEAKSHARVESRVVLLTACCAVPALFFLDYSLLFLEPNINTDSSSRAPYAVCRCLWRNCDPPIVPPPPTPTG